MSDRRCPYCQQVFIAVGGCRDGAFMVLVISSYPLIGDLLSQVFHYKLLPK